MRVRELIDMLSDQPPDAVVQLVIVGPVEDDDDVITVDRFGVDALLPWQDDRVDLADDPELEEADGLCVWLIGGEDADVDALIDQLEHEAEGR